MAGGYSYQDRKIPSTGGRNVSNEWSVARTSNGISDPNALDGICDLDLVALAFKGSFALAVPHAHHGWHDNSEGSTNPFTSFATLTRKGNRYTSPDHCKRSYNITRGSMLKLCKDKEGEVRVLHTTVYRS